MTIKEIYKTQNDFKSWNLYGVLAMSKNILIDTTNTKETESQF